MLQRRRFLYEVEKSTYTFLWLAEVLYNFSLNKKLTKNFRDECITCCECISWWVIYNVHLVDPATRSGIDPSGSTPWGPVPGVPGPLRDPPGGPRTPLPEAPGTPEFGPRDPVPEAPGTPEFGPRDPEFAPPGGPNLAPPGGLRNPVPEASGTPNSGPGPEFGPDPKK